MLEPANPATSLMALRRTAGHAVVIAHRGASAQHSENTLAAFLAAWDAGGQWVAAYTQPTADGVPGQLAVGSYHEHDASRPLSGPESHPGAAEGELTDRTVDRR